MKLWKKWKMSTGHWYLLLLHAPRAEGGATSCFVNTLGTKLQKTILMRVHFHLISSVFIMPKYPWPFNFTRPTNELKTLGAFCMNIYWYFSRVWGTQHCLLIADTYTALNIPRIPLPLNSPQRPLRRSGVALPSPASRHFPSPGASQEGRCGVNLALSVFNSIVLWQQLFLHNFFVLSSLFLWNVFYFLSLQVSVSMMSILSLHIILIAVSQSQASYWI